jgi:hypothetical protein
MPTLNIPSSGRDRIARFQGIDRRRRESAAQQNTVWDAVNVRLTPGGGFARMPTLEAIDTLHPNSVGLYSAGGMLRAVVPAGYGIERIPAMNVQYDPIGDSSSVAPDLSRYRDVTAVATWGINSSEEMQPYLVVRTSGDQYEHHWIRDPIGKQAISIDTMIRLPFEPGPHLVKAAGKLFASEIRGVTVHYSSTLQGLLFQGSLPVEIARLQRWHGTVTA